MQNVAGNHQASSGFHPFFKSQQPMVEKFNAGLTDPSFHGPISGTVVRLIFQFILLHQYIKEY